MLNVASIAAKTAKNVAQESIVVFFRSPPSWMMWAWLRKLRIAGPAT